MIKALCFDAFGTLFDFNTVNNQSMYKHDLNDTQRDALRSLWQMKQLQYFWNIDINGGYRSFEDITREALRYALWTVGSRGGKKIENVFMKGYESMEPFQDILYVLPKLREAGITLVIHSNCNRTFLDKVLRGTPHLLSHFEHLLGIFTVEDHGDSPCDTQFKPAYRAYNMLPEALGLKKTEIGYVTGNCWDAHGSNHYGFTSFWINRHQLPDEKMYSGHVDFQYKTAIGLLNHVRKKYGKAKSTVSAEA